MLVLSLAPGPAWHTPRGSAQSMPCYCSGKACQCLRLRAHALGTRLPDAAPHASAGLRRRRRPSRPQASTATRNHQGVAHRRAHRPMCWRGRAERRPARTRHRTPPRARGPCCARYYALALALALTPAQLGALSAARGLTQALASPVAGLLGDAWHRGRIIAAGTLAWAGASLAFGLCVNYPQARGPQARRSRAWPLRGARLRSQPRPQAAGAGVRGAVRRGPRARDAVRDGHRGWTSTRRSGAASRSAGCSARPPQVRRASQAQHAGGRAALSIAASASASGATDMRTLRPCPARRPGHPCRSGAGASTSGTLHFA